MGTIQLFKPSITLFSQPIESDMFWDTVDTDGAGIPFVDGDLISYVTARNAWGKAVATDDAAATTILAFALDNVYDDPYTRPFDKTVVFQGVNKLDKFRRLKLTETDLHLNVNINRDLVAGDIGSAFGLLYVGDNATGVMTVDTTNTTNQHFLILGLSNPTDPNIGGTFGDKQVRVRGRLVSSRT